MTDGHDLAQLLQLGEPSQLAAPVIERDDPAILGWGCQLSHAEQARGEHVVAPFTQQSRDFTPCPAAAEGAVHQQVTHDAAPEGSSGHSCTTTSA